MPMSRKRGGNRPTPSIGPKLNYLTLREEEVLGLAVKG